MSRYENKDGISDNELLIIRHLKHDRGNDQRLKRLVANYYLVDTEYVTKEYIFNCLFNIIEKFDLLLSPDKGRGFFINRESFAPDFDDIWDLWIYKAKSRIALSEVKKFPRYPVPAVFRNKKG